MVAVALLSRFTHPHLYPVATGDSVAIATPSSATVPQFILPALSLAAVSGETNPPSSSVDSENGVADTGVTAEESPLGLAATVNAGTVSVVPLGPVYNSTFSRVGGTPPPSLAVEASLVADLTTTSRFMSENETERWPLASVTKLMTATVVLDKLNPAQQITITKDDVNVDPSEELLHVGDTYTVTDLLRFLLLPSSNVAAEALARAYGRTQFITEMNARAAAWGMKNTYYADPSGLATGSQSTAADLVLLAQKIYSTYPKILEITRTPQVTVTEIDSGAQIVVKNINEFSGRADFIGGKTGYTDQADGNLLSLFLYEGHPIVVVVLGTDEDMRFTNTEALYNWFTSNFSS